MNQEADEGLHIILPGIPVLRRHNEGLIEEGAPLHFALLLPRQLARHEGEFHEGLHSRFEHVVIGDPAGIEIIFLKGFPSGNGHLHGEVVEGPHVVAKDPVKADMLNAQGVVDELQLADIIRPQRQERMAGADAELPVFLMGMGRRIFPNADFHIVSFLSADSESSPGGIPAGAAAGRSPA